MDGRIKLVVADDHKISVDGIKAIVSSNPSIEIVGEAYTGKQVMDLLEVLSPDVVLMDIEMPEMDGLEATKLIKNSYPDIKVLILSMHKSGKFVREAFKNGVDGYILKESGQEECLPAIKMIAAGGKYIGVGISMESDRAQVNEVVFSTREMEILELIAQGKTTKQISEELFITDNTVNTHRKNLFNKAEVHNVTELLNWARENGAL